MTPNGHIYLGTNFHGITDFSVKSGELRGLFIHEMMHVWQHQQGVNVIARGIYTQAKQQITGNQYNYRLDGKKLLKDYNIEQQGDIVRDYFFAVEENELKRAGQIEAALGNFPNGY